MSAKPLSSAEQSKIMIFVLTMLPTIFFIVGIIPALFLIFGTFMMKKNNDFSHIETAVRNYKCYVFLALGVAASFAMYYATTLGAKDRYDRHGAEFIISLAFAGIAIIYILLVNKLFLSPLASHTDWVANNGIFTNKPKKMTLQGGFEDIDIIKGERLKSFSVADELIKWAKLKEDGHISEQEFNDARKKLLQRG